VGKTPVKVARNLKKKISVQDLKVKLANAIEQEAFEEAARIRDQIKEIEKKQESP
jgi:protein arginine kinase activator